jgi:hypothetical protein
MTEKHDVDLREYTDTGLLIREIESCGEGCIALVTSDQLDAICDRAEDEHDDPMMYAIPMSCDACWRGVYLRAED